MSHTMNIKLELRDADALLEACSRIDGAESLGYGEHRLFETKETGFGIKFDKWRYPIVVKPNGTIAYDDFNGAWGNVTDLNKLSAYYGLEKAKIEARRAGHDFYESYNEQKQEIELRIAI